MNSLIFSVIEADDIDFVVGEPCLPVVAPPPSTGGTPHVVNLAPTNGQTTFSLPWTATTPSNSLLFLNGWKYRYGIDYIISGSTLTWLNSVDLETADQIDVYLDRSQNLQSVELIPTSGQTVFPLSVWISSPATALVFLNGWKYRYGTDYALSPTVFSWLVPWIALDPNDRIEIFP